MATSVRNALARNLAGSAGTSYIDPQRFYTRAGFIRDSGISATRLREARLQGIEANWLYVGRRKFLRGTDAIEFIERLAQLGA